MYLPQSGDYIDIHVHDGKPAPGIFILESLMAHEGKLPEDVSGVAYTYGIHPWFLNQNNHRQLLNSVENSVSHRDIIAVGESGFDRLKGPSIELQRMAFEEQIAISEKTDKPVVVHCVKAWDELLSVQKKIKPKMPWLVHGFRGNKELADQLLSKGIYLSFWYDFVLRPESGALLKHLPVDRIFLETDGADTDIRKIYEKVAKDLDLSVDKLKSVIISNYINFFDV
ncbi:MAG: TatD family hydrolase [Bacteroidales bacterium]|jgi:TatD DNase family protein